MKDYILVINSGSATLKFKIFKIADLELQLAGIVERIGLPRSFINIEELTSKRIIAKNYPEGIKNHQQALQIMTDNLKCWRDKIKVIGHRVVCGGAEFIKPTVVNDTILEKLKNYNELAPLHNPINLTCLEGCLNLWPGAKNVAVFDTAFYKTLPAAAYNYGLPRDITTKYKIRRYGFHGLSHQYVAEVAAKKLKKSLAKLKLVSCHLGSGCSITAIRAGAAVDTSMGFSPTAGVVMGTRSGDIDPVLPLFLQRKLNLKLGEMEDLLNKQSGFLGIFGSADMRDVLRAAGYKVAGFVSAEKFTDEKKALAKLALEMFIYQIVKYIGSYVTILGGVDAIVFTAGIGERSPVVRQLIKRRLKFLKQAKYLVVPTDEEVMIAKSISRMKLE